MKTMKMRTLILGLAIFLTGALVQAQKPGEQPIGWSKTRAANIPIKPIYASEIDKETEELSTEADQMNQQVQKAKINPEADSVEKAWPDSISLERHKADIAAFRDKFTNCMTAMQHQIQEKIDSGKATDEDRAQFKKCMTHCQAILKTLNDMHYNASAMTTANRKIYFLEGWDKHKKLMAQLKDQMQSCPSLMKGTQDCCKMTEMNMPKESGAATGTGTKKPAASDVVYTCPMHPDVVQAQPGKCPICGMNLEPKKK